FSNITSERLTIERYLDTGLGPDIGIKRIDVRYSRHRKPGEGNRTQGNKGKYNRDNG
ncbi:MAG TPA: hypothetical protein GX692_00655, partial [Acholeplasmataceae bacterium]|nr:hypothetical protein [Acholeplasmataceae bacterium]